jgi:hypothetical protein
MIIELSVKERLELPLILPDRGGFIQHEIAEMVKTKVRFTGEEIMEFELKDISGGQVIWTAAKAKVKPFDFTEAEINLLKKGVDQMDQNENIPAAFFSLCKRIRELSIQK